MNLDVYNLVIYIVKFSFLYEMHTYYMNCTRFITIIHKYFRQSLQSSDIEFAYLFSFIY